jgi:predicted O-methyltransferase YrrM
MIHDHHGGNGGADPAVHFSGAPEMTPHTPDSLLALARDFQESRVLLTGAELNLFTLLAPEPLGRDEIASKIAADPRALEMLLDALAAQGLLAKNGGKWQTEPSVAPFLVEQAEGSILPMILHAANLWNNWSGLTRKVVPRRAEASGPEFLAAFIGAMHVVAAPQADLIAAAVGGGGARRLLDVGGASGTYTLAFLRANPGMTATLFDRPAVVEMARKRVGAAGFLPRVTLAGGDFATDPLPPGHDLAFVSAIIHQNSPGENLALYRKIHEALVPGGRLIIRDHVMQPDRTRPRAGALFAINMLVGTARGGTYTFDEIAGGLRQAGFERVRLVQSGERMDALVEAFKAG